MGWGSGSRMMNGIAEKLKKAVPDYTNRFHVYMILIPEFEEMDWDTQDESLDVDPALDMAMKTLHPDWFKDSD